MVTFWKKASYAIREIFTLRPELMASAYYAEKSACLFQGNPKW